MKLIATIEGDESEISFERTNGNVVAFVDGRKYELECSVPERNIYLLKHNGKIFEVFVSPDSAEAEPVKVKVGTHDIEVDVVDPKRLRGSAGQGDLADGAVEIKTAMPGKVVRILHGENDEVKSGEGVIIVEAMKMQNEMKSPKDGVVKEICFAEGDTVNAGDVLVVIE